MSGLPELNELHLLLTYRCDSECDHCFVWSSPRSWATMSLEQVRDIIDQASELDGVDTVYFEGGEPFLYYPLLVAGADYAHRKGLDVGIVTNGYWASSEEDAMLWLEPLMNKGIVDLSISMDDHHGEGWTINARRAESTARKAGFPVNILTVPGVGDSEGGLYFRGRAVDKLVKDAPKRPIKELGGCPEDPPHIKRLYIDPYGNVLFCQGISLGNMNNQPLAQIIGSFVAEKHPIIGPLMKGLADLAKAGGFNPSGEYAGACHLCYAIRTEMISRRMYRLILKPLQAYGMEGMD